MIPQIKRHEIRALLRAGRSQNEVARFSGVSLRTVKRIGAEPEIQSFDDAAERRRRRIGRPSVVEGFREFVTTLLEQEPGVKSSKILKLARTGGYTGGKSAMYALVASIRKNGNEGANAAPRLEITGSESRNVLVAGPDPVFEKAWIRSDSQV